MKTAMKKDHLTELREKLLVDQEVQTMIAMRAYEIYLTRGSQPGREADDWFQAEGEILSILIDEELRRVAQPISEELLPDSSVAYIVPTFPPPSTLPPPNISAEVTKQKKGGVGTKAAGRSTTAKTDKKSVPELKAAKKGGPSKASQQKAAPKIAALEPKKGEAKAKKKITGGARLNASAAKKGGNSRKKQAADLD
jgi:hypothetical protein